MDVSDESPDSLLAIAGPKVKPHDALSSMPAEIAARTWA